MYTQQSKYITAGKPVDQAKAALIMLHGRGSSAQNIISLADRLDAADLAIFAPQADQHTWYPYSFMAPDDQNQPELDNALAVVDDLVNHITAQGIAAKDIFFLGFSQGACLTLEYIARKAQRYAGVIAFTGGLIGEVLDPSHYNGDLEGTPILITTGDPDPHVPLTRVQESVSILKSMHADVTTQVYEGRPHTITLTELHLADKIILRAKDANV